MSGSEKQSNAANTSQQLVRGGGLRSAIENSFRGSGWSLPDPVCQGDKLLTSISNRRLADRWLGRDMKHGLTSDDKSITVGNMKYAHATPDVYECAGLTPRQRD